MSKNIIGAYRNLTEIRRKCKNDQATYTEAKYLRAQEIAINELNFRRNSKSWEKFCNSQLWQTKKAGNPPLLNDDSTALHHSFVFAYADITDCRDMPSLHCRAVKALLAAGVQREDIAEELKKHGGFTGVLKKNNKTAGVVTKDSNEKQKKSSLEKVLVDLDTQLIGNHTEAKIRKICDTKEGDTFWVEYKNMGSKDDGLFDFKAIAYDKI